jgi:putative colanic acid biosynthesis acetyltransferase WcaB
MTGQIPVSWWQLVKSDLKVNKSNWKGFLLLLLYRLAHAHLTAPIYARPFSFLYLIFYKVFTELFVGTEIHWRCEIGPGARVFHGFGLVIHSATKIGSNVVLRNGTTIGIKSTDGDISAPRIGDYVDIGASAILLGGITIGHHAVIGAGAVVVKSIPEGAVVVGNPGRIIRIAGQTASGFPTTE